jgi:predicted PurR-regulated permease PerM
MVDADNLKKTSWMMTLASIAVVTAALYLGKGVLVPLTLAVLLSFLLSRWAREGEMSLISDGKSS